MTKTLLVLGAALYQVECILTAKRLGYRVITADNRPSNPGHRLSDVSYNVDTTDVHGVLQLAKREKISGVISPCTDVAVKTAAIVSHKSGLPGVPPSAAQIVTDKVSFRRFMLESQLPTPRFVVLGESDQLIPELFTGQGGATKMVLKPQLSSGSKGVFIVGDRADLEKRLPESRAMGLSRTCLIEDYLEGPQGTCVGILEAGRIQLAVVLDRQVAHEPFTTTIGHRVPSTLSEESQRQLIDLISDVWRRLGVTDTVFDCDFVWTNCGPFILEITPRLGGNGIPLLIQLASGIDLIEYSVRSACGDLQVSEAVDWGAVRIEPSAVVLLGVWNEGRLDYDESQVAELRTEPWVKSLSLDMPIGAPVGPFVNGRLRLGEALIKTADRRSLDERVQELIGRISICAK
jgi:biotin carboxylase